MDQYAAMLGMGMPTTPQELEMMRAAQMARETMTAGTALPYARGMMGQIPAGGFSPKDLFGLAGSGIRAPMMGAGLLGRGMQMADPAERMFSPGIFSFLRGL